jgi:hypothetical protein
MNRNATREHWLKMLSQAEHMLAKENCIDAARRVELLVGEVKDALAVAAVEDRLWIERDLFLFEKESLRFKSAYDKWCDSVRTRSESNIAREKALYKAPVPGVAAPR